MPNASPLASGMDLICIAIARMRLGGLTDPQIRDALHTAAANLEAVPDGR